MIRVAVLGVTGSIGAAALDVARSFPDRIRLVSLAARRDDRGLLAAADAFGVKRVALVDPEAAARVRAQRADWDVWEGEEALAGLAADDGVDVVVNAVVGGVGLRPTLAALERGKRVALANKESVVMGGELLAAAAARGGGRIVPVDSEHSGVFQCLEGREAEGVRKIILTASGGPFLRRDPDSLARVTPEEVLRHPTWRMGERITVDSATLMNKGFEVIEGRWLFGIEPERIEVVIHPQSVVHALVEFRDGSVAAQLSAPDMRLPLLYALSHPDRWESDLPKLDLARYGSLQFEAPDPARCPGLALARRALSMGGTAPTVLNAADEEAVRLFLGRTIRFTDICRLVGQVLEEHDAPGPLRLDAIEAADRWARERLRARACASGAS